MQKQEKFDVITLRPSRGGKRKFAVEDADPVVTSDYQSDRIWSQSDQTYTAKVWLRAEDRGYVCLLEGGGQWSNRGDHGDYQKSPESPRL